MILRHRSNRDRKPLTVALVGADGAGKTTMAHRLQANEQIPIKYLYMGVSRQSSNRMLPTTWLLWQLKRLAGKRERGGPPDPARRRSKNGKPLARVLRQAKGAVRLLNLLAEELYRQALTVYYQWQGYTVLFDRHFYLDYYAHDIAPPVDTRTLWQRLHGFFLQHVLPRPGLVVLLDAPADVLFARKPEGSVELLQKRREEYWRLLESAREKGLRFVVVDATLDVDEVQSDILSAITRAARPQSASWTLETATEQVQAKQ